MARGADTRNRVMDIAQAAILAKGFSATSIEEVIAQAQITKSGFFYHFKDKNELARALLKRYLEEEDQVLDDVFRRAAELHEDPLHAFLIGLKLLAEMMADLPTGHPGCLVATLCYSERLYDRSVRDLNRSVVLGWRRRFVTLLEAIAERYPPCEEVDLQALADMVSSTVEGGIVLSKALQQPKLLAEQIMLLRSYIRLLFLPQTGVKRPAG